MPALSDLLDGSVSPTPRSSILGPIADALAKAQAFANRANVPQSVPFIGGQGVGDMLLGRAPDEVNEWSYGNAPMQVVGGGAGSYIPQVKQGRAQSLADAMFAFGPMIKGATGAPSAARVALSDLARHSGGLPAGQVGSIGATLSESERAARMAAMNMDRGWYRGGAQIGADGRRSGPMYTQSPEEAAGYLHGFQKRTGQTGDLREYAIPGGRFLNADKNYPSKLAHDVANILDDPYFDKPGAQLAKELRTFGPDEPISGGQIWQALESRFGNDGAAEVLDRLKAFSGAKGFTAPGEAYVFPSAPVRDANKAAFVKANSSVDDIYGYSTLSHMLAGGAAGAMGLEALRRTSGRE